MKKIVLLRGLFAVMAILIIAIFFSYLLGAYYNYFYPMDYKEEIIAAANKNNVSPALLASIANVESGFNEKAVSVKGAVGILQLVPSTAKWLAQKKKLSFSEEKLKDAEYNLDLGAYYLSFLLQEFESERVAICAYNAGQGNVKQWLANKEYSTDGKILDKIPFLETRNYLTKVLNNYNYYKNKYK